MALATPCPTPASGYMCIESPVEWFVIDVLAIATVVWILATLWYKGVRHANLMRYPQMQMLIPYSQWESKLLREKPPIGAGKALSAFFKTLFVDVLAMNILKCEFGLSEKEVVKTRTAKRTAKLLMVWGFVFAGISTTLAYLMFPHNKIVLDLTHPARIFGMLGGVFMIIGALIWFSARYKEAKYAGPFTPAKFDWIGADYLPLMVLLLGVSGFVLQGAILAYASMGEVAEPFLYFAIHFHAIPVAAFFWLFFWTKADHIIYRIFWRIYEYADKDFAGTNTRLPPPTIKYLNKSGKEIKGGYA